jgi:ferredoxin
MPPAEKAKAARVPVTFVSMDGERWNVEAIEGETLLETARRYLLPIPGLCEGGDAPPEQFGEGPMCRSCHVYIDPDHIKALPPKSQDEVDLSEWIKNKNEL